MPQTAEQILQQEFLLARAKILELAATLDRLERAGGPLSSHPQIQLLNQGLAILNNSTSPTTPPASRAEQVQLLFSRQYSANWRQTLGV